MEEEKITEEITEKNEKRDSLSENNIVKEVKDSFLE